MTEVRLRPRVAHSFVAAAVVWIAASLLATAAHAQPCQHGASVFKTCASPKRSCTGDADCNDSNPCTADRCRTEFANTTDCTLSFSHADTCGDTTRINEAFDVQDFGGDDVRVPAVGNLPISGVFGNAVCCPGPVFPCFVGPAGSNAMIPAIETGCGDLVLPGAGSPGLVTVQQNTYVIQPNDPDPLPDQANFRVRDRCDVVPSGCSTGVNTVQFTAATDLENCEYTTSQLNSTPCPDTDGNACTTAGCDGLGGCSQTHVLVPDSDPCPDTDGDSCTTAGCNGLGMCSQTHITCTTTSTSSSSTSSSSSSSTSSSSSSSTSSSSSSSSSSTSTSSSSSSTVTSTTVPCPGLDHFKCYRTLEQTVPRFQPRTLPLTDQFGTTSAEVLRPDRLCNPVDKNGEGIDDPTAHLMCYDIKETGFQRREVMVTNQFGSQNLSVVRPVNLCNPATKDGVPSALELDHFKCYRVRGRGFTRPIVTMVDQFETRTAMLVKPQLLCNPVDKNGSGIQFPACHLTCYRIKSGQPRFTPQDVTVEDQFALQDLRSLRGECHRADILCVPSDKIELP